MEGGVGINSEIKYQWLKPSLGTQKGKAKERPKDD